VLVGKLEDAGVPAELIVIPDVGHRLIGKTHEKRREATLKALHATFDFIDKTIGASR
jgi:dipeptidyl aminopeptidase/acylaminoacyl peptidase